MDNENLGKSDQETLVEDENANNKRKDQTKQPLEREALRLACDNWTRKVSEFRKASSKDPSEIQLTEIKEAPNIGCGPRNEIENKASEWNLKSEEGLKKAYETWNKNIDKFKIICTHKKERPKKENHSASPPGRNPKMHTVLT
ncbi:hypothetical protein C2G38_2171330 [Gigaspora rosea]|uniref:Uncharacterized protein n=1 Tax=Gigaspora rosea TaxID=44941 RepID=A0A397VLU7_9GLOM|nr:hypothetical protein C2G38_2171330 [Gigaspora rosea]